MRGIVQLACRHEAEALRPSSRTAEVAVRFGLAANEPARVVLDENELGIRRGQVVLIVGPSGSGKSSTLAAVARQAPSAVDVTRVTFPHDRAIVDCVAPCGGVAEAAAVLTTCGLGEPRLWLRPYAALSDGEKFRARLARAIGMQAAPASPLHRAASFSPRDATHVTPLLCDEFGSNLHRRIVHAIAFNLRKLAERRGLCLILAAANDDFAADLAPHTVVRLRGCGTCEIVENAFQPNRAISLCRNLRIVAGRKADYEAFAAMHYRATDELGFVDKVFVMRERPSGEPLGIVVYSHPPLELGLRNQATNGWFSHNPARVNSSLRILRRLVIHPDVRGCGLGHHLVKRTLPRVGTDYVECLASMGEFNPIFEKAGMCRIGQYEISPMRRKALDELRAMGIDPSDRDFAVHVGRKPRVRAIVARIVYDWYDKTTVGGEKRVQRQSPEVLAQTFRGLIGSRPVYYLWKKKQRHALRAAA